jgi:hypothetical protein
MNFDDFYNRALKNENSPMWRNGQTYILGDSASEAALAKIEEQVQEGRLILLVTGRFEESCVVLERLFQDDFKDCSYIRYNVSPKKKTITESQRSAISQYMDLDINLLTLSNDYLDATLERLFPNLHERQQYVNDFVQRCLSKE